MMDCFNKCFSGTKETNIETNLANVDKKIIITDPENADKESNTKSLTEFYSSLQEVIKGLKNIKNKQPANAEEMKKIITNMAQKYDQQTGDIEEMKQKINDITSNTKNIDALQEITSDLKNIKTENAFGKVVNTVTSTLETALKALQESKEKESKLSAELTETNKQKESALKALEESNKEKNKLSEELNKMNKQNETALKALQKSQENEKQLSTELANAKKQMEKDFNKIHKPKEAESKSSVELAKAKIEIDKRKLQANILAQSNLVDYSAPSNKEWHEVNESGGFQTKKDIFGNPAKIYFLSKNGRQILKENNLTKAYDVGVFSKSAFYHYKDGKYTRLDNLKDIESLETKNIILAFQKKN